MAYDPNAATNEAAKRSRDLAQKNMEDLAKMHRPPPGGAADRQGSPLGFVIVVVLAVLVALWIASMQ